MEIENEIFKRKRLKPDALVPFGFTEVPKGFCYSAPFLESFRADIFIDESGRISGKVHDTDVDEEYTNFRISGQIGFAKSVREAYEGILKNIAAHCYESLLFITPQANRIAQAIADRYACLPEFLWDNHPGFGVFRNAANKKWFGAIMNIDKSKIDSGSGEVEIMNVKLAPDEIHSLLPCLGFYRCYHMDKTHWITLILDETLSDETVLSCVEKSRLLTL